MGLIEYGYSDEKKQNPNKMNKYLFLVQGTADSVFDTAPQCPPGLPALVPIVWNEETRLDPYFML